MPWKETCAMEERMRFVVAATEEGAVMSQVCAEFGISRQAGYQRLRRYEAEGVEGLKDRSRAPHHHGLSREAELVVDVLGLREHYGWGAKKLRHKLGELRPDIESADRFASRDRAGRDADVLISRPDKHRKAPLADGEWIVKKGRRNIERSKRFAAQHLAPGRAHVGRRLCEIYLGLSSHRLKRSCSRSQNLSAPTTAHRAACLHCVPPRSV